MKLLVERLTEEETLRTKRFGFRMWVFRVRVKHFGFGSRVFRIRVQGSNLRFGL